MYGAFAVIEYYEADETNLQLEDILQWAKDANKLIDVLSEFVSFADHTKQCSFLVSGKCNCGYTNLVNLYRETLDSLGKKKDNESS